MQYVVAVISCIFYVWIVTKVSDATTRDLYNSKSATSDLQWMAYPQFDGWEEVTGLYNSHPIRYYQVCNTKDPNADNWVRTPYIHSHGAKRAYIDVEFSMLKCDSEKAINCRETFNLYYFESYDDVASSTYPPWQERPYIKIDTIAAGKLFSNSEGENDKKINRKTWTLGPLTKKGFYIAAHDKGACMSLISLHVYYFYCNYTEVALAQFAETVAGKEVASLVPVNGKCTRHSKSASRDGPRYHCNSNGEWKVRTGSCQCSPGYEPSPDTKQCTACLTGKYKSTAGNYQCETCPANSESYNVKSLHKEVRAPVECRCQAGYFRALNEDIHHACSGTPLKPEHVSAVVNETTAVITWSQPGELGGRNDTFYNITCEVCSTPLYKSCSQCPPTIAYFPADRGIAGRRVQISFLDAFTNYRFKVHALNGVSSVSMKPSQYELVQVTTSQAAPSAVVSVRVLQSEAKSVTVAWAQPRHPNGNLRGYEVIIQQIDKENDDKGGLTARDHLPAVYKTHNRSMAISDLLPGSIYSIQVRARTAAGYGDYSDVFIAHTKEAVDSTSGISDTNRVKLLIGIGASVAVFLVVCAVSYFVYLGRKKMYISERFEDSMDGKEPYEDERHLVVRLPAPASSGHRVYVEYPDPQKAVREFSSEIDPQLITIEDTIGQGEFGEVCRGKLRDSTNKSSPVQDVAIKRLKQGADLKDQLNFLREASTMAQFSHPNVLLLKGVVTKSRPLMIVSEFMEHGSLDTFLKKHQDELSVLQLINVMRGIAAGMRYLADMQYVHRDLAARNILVSRDQVCKVSDFGLSRTLENDPHATYTTQGGKIALRWTAPECIRYRQFTSASDVWSFGIVMWEVMSYGEKPYWDMTNQDVLESIEEGYRLPAPYECPSILHKTMIECWAMDTKQRPTFEQLVLRLDEIVHTPDLFNATTPSSQGSNCKSSDNVSAEEA